MPKIDVQTFAVGHSAADTIESSLLTPTLICGDAPVIGDVDVAVELLRSQPARDGCRTIRFVVSDFPFLTVVWQQFGKLAAIVHVLRNGRAERVHLLLSGRDVEEEHQSVKAVRALLAESFPSDFMPYLRTGNDVFHHTFVLRPIEDDENDFSHLLGMICIVPIFCQSCGIH